MLLRCGAMTAGYGSEFDPTRLDLDDHSSGGDTDDCTFVSTRSSFHVEDRYIVPSLLGKTEVAPSCLGRMEVTPSPPVRMEVTLSPVKMEITPSPPVEIEVTSSRPVRMEDTPSPAVRMEVAEPSTTVKLTPEQHHVLDFVRAGKNVFFSGPGGTGKTVVLQEILKFFRRRYNKPHSDYLHLGHACECFSCNVAITAPTGIAAIPIGGSTLHRATGIGIPRRPNDFNRMWHKPIRLKWRNLRVLIIDEISMVSAELLEYLEQTIRRIRTKEVNLPGEPFGGLQVIFAGDFFQLQPVEDKDTKTCAIQFLNRGLAFEAPAWDRANLKTVILKRVFRQKDDHFVDLLNGIRTGESRAALEEIFENCSRPLRVADGIHPTVLYARNMEVDQFNNEKLNGLKSQEVILNADEEILTKEGLKAEEERNEGLRQVQERILFDAEFWKDCLAPDQIKLKTGAQVMLLRNLELEGNENDLVNGSRGILVGWKRKEQVLSEYFQLQRECIEILKKRHETNEERKVRIRVEQKIENLQNSTIDFIPIVKFMNRRRIDCVPEKFSYEFLNVGDCIRRQVPLKLAWALTIHKCQGMTLDYVKVNLQDIFAEGQVYVALSRARSMAGLQVEGNCSAKDVKVSQRVVEFYKAVAAKEVPSVGKFLFPEIVFEIPPEEMMVNARRKVDGRLVNGRTSMPSRAEELSERCPPEILLEAENLFERCTPEILPETEKLFTPEILPETEKLFTPEILPETEKLFTPEILPETEKLCGICTPETLPEIEKLCGRCPSEILPETVVCYHCKKEGHPAFKCKLGPLLIINE